MRVLLACLTVLSLPSGIQIGAALGATTRGATQAFEERYAPNATPLDLREPAQPLPDLGPAQYAPNVTLGGQSGAASPAPLATATEGYVDQVLDDSPLEALEPVHDREDAGPLGPGRSTYAARYVAYGRKLDDQRLRTETAVEGRWSRETLEYGNLDVEVSAARRRDSNGAAQRDGDAGRFVVRHTGFVVGERTIVDSALGDHVAQTNPLVSRSFRLNLPAAFVRGLSSVASDARQELRVSAGQVGRLSGDRVFSFQAEEPWLVGGGYQRQLSERLDAGAQLWLLQGSESSEDHASAAAAVRYRDEPGERELALHVLHDTEGNVGIWADVDHRLGGWRHRYGALRLEPGLRWLDDPIGADRISLYWRGEMNQTRQNLVAGLSFEETNIEALPDVFGSRRWFGFTRASRQLSGRVRAGGALAVTLVRPGEGRPAAEQDRHDLSAFTTYRSRLGTTRAEVDASLLRPREGPGSEEYNLLVDQRWAMARGSDLSTQARYFGERGISRLDGVALSVLGRTDLTSDLQWRGDGTTVFSHSDALETRSLQLATGLVWRVAADWRLDLSGDVAYTENVPRAGPTTELTDWEVLLELSWSGARGTTPVYLGRRSESVGAGRIAGVVFFDENRDGLRSADEKPAAGVFVQLDGRRASTRTDAAGRFEFFPVFAGLHEVSLFLEDLPLPWGLDDEAPVGVDVAARRTAEVTFPLVRLGQ